jgi:Uma2 family endonuclease
MESTVVTAEQLVHIGGHCDLLRGKVRTMTPPGPVHGRVTAQAILQLGNHVCPRRLGAVYGDDTGFFLGRDPDTVLGPDVAFVSAERTHLEPKRGYFPGPPDLAVEVRSSDDSRRALASKARQWIRYGCRLVLTLDPSDERAQVYRPGAPVQRFGRGDGIDVGDVVAGLVMRVGELFEA